MISILIISIRNLTFPITTKEEAPNIREISGVILSWRAISQYILKTPDYGKLCQSTTVFSQFEGLS